MTVRGIVRMGDPLLRQRARELSPGELRTEPFQTLIRDMIETMRSENGAGIAAPQVGHSVRICVVELEHNPRYPDFPPIPCTVLVNPKLEVTVPTSPLASKDTVAIYEGCLSVPGIRGLVRRPRSVRWTALDQNGNNLSDEWHGFPSAVIQHECDHLDGTLFVDRADIKTLTFLEEYYRYVPENQRTADGGGIQ